MSDDKPSKSKSEAAPKAKQPVQKNTEKATEDKKGVEDSIEATVEAIADAPADVRRHLPVGRLVKWSGALVIVLLLGWLVLSRGDDMIAKPFIETQLNKIAENIASQAALSGDEAKLTYGKVSVEGGVFNKKAIIRDLKLEYTAQLPFSNTQKTILTTPKAFVTADQIQSQTINIKFPEPFAVTREDYQPLSLTFEGAPVYKFHFDGDMEAHELKLPNKLVLGVDAQSDNPVEVAVHYAADPIFKRSINHATSENTSQIKIHNISLSSNVESNEIRVGDFAFNSKELTGQPDTRKFDSQVDIGSVEIQQLDKVMGPYYLTADVSGDYKSTRDAEGKASVTHVNMDVKKLTLSTNEYDVTAIGSFSRVPEDPMLFGAGNIVIQGLDKFRNSELVNIEDNRLKDLLIATITGNADINATSAEFAVRREQSGTFFIGKTTFENLIGTVVTHVLSQQKQDAASPVLEAPVAAPAPEPVDPLWEDATMQPTTKTPDAKLQANPVEAPTADESDAAPQPDVAE